MSLLLSLVVEDAKEQNGRLSRLVIELNCERNGPHGSAANGAGRPLTMRCARPHSQKPQCRVRKS